VWHSLLNITVYVNNAQLQRTIRSVLRTVSYVFVREVRDSLVLWLCYAIISSDKLCSCVFFLESMPVN
jgi:hypothetical protein